MEAAPSWQREGAAPFLTSVKTKHPATNLLYKLRSSGNVFNSLHNGTLSAKESSNTAEKPKRRAYEDERTDWVFAP